MRGEAGVCRFVLPTASLSIAELFSSPYLLNVPIYQRSYSWGGELAEQLYDDLTEAMSVGVDDVNDSGYFLGTILLMDGSGAEMARLSPKLSAREFDVVDGQQRIVTLMTLFAVLRDLETAPRAPIGRRAQAMLTAQLGARFFRTERYRLHLAGVDRSFFESHILWPGATALTVNEESLSQSELALLSARETLKSLVGELSEAARNELFAYVADRCHVVVIVSNDIDRAYRLFVVLNERGRRLRRNDILKADLLSRMTPTAVDSAANQWEAISLSLGEDFEAFFAHVRTIFGYARPQIVSGVRAAIKESGGAEPFFNTVFLPLSKAYIDIRRDAGGLPPELQRHLFYLNRLADGDWAPAAMLAVRDWQINPARAAMLIAEIDRLAHLMRLLCAGGPKRLRRFGEVISVLRKREPIDSSHPVFRLTREETRSVAFHLKDLHKRNPKACKLLLLRLSDELSDSITHASPELYTIEHVLPQRPSGTSEWRSWFPTPEDRAECVESLGNLVLISQSQNDKARNQSWSAKKQIYAASPPFAPLLPITREVLQAESWRRAEIEAREDKLIRLIEKIWRIDLPAARSARSSAAE